MVNKVQKTKVAKKPAEKDIDAAYDQLARFLYDLYLEEKTKRTE
jgi:hypothetical protein